MIITPVVPRHLSDQDRIETEDKRRGTRSSVRPGRRDMLFRRASVQSCHYVRDGDGRRCTPTVGTVGALHTCPLAVTL